MFFNVTANKTARITCTLVSPAHSDAARNTINCPPDQLISLVLPSTFTCGVVRVSASGEASATDTAMITGRTTDNCPLNPTLSLSYDFANSELQINAQSDNSDAILDCKVNDDRLIRCNSSTTVSKPAGATYTVTLLVNVGVERASVTVTLVVPATQGPPATATLRPLGATPPANLRVNELNGEATWDAVTDATGYEVEVAVGSSTTGETVTVTGVNKTRLTNASNCCVLGEQYVARVRAVQNTNRTAWSRWEVFKFNQTSTIPATPVPFTVTLELEYVYGTGLLWYTIASSKVVDFSCEINGVPFACSAGRNSMAKAANAEYIVTASATYRVRERGDVTETARVHLVVPASPGPVGTPTDTPTPAPTPSPTQDPSGELTLWWSGDDIPWARFSNENSIWQVFMRVATSKLASAICHLVEPKHPDEEDNSVTCVPNNLVKLQLPSSYDCGPVKVRAQAISVDRSEIAEISGVTADNCALGPTENFRIASDGIATWDAVRDAVGYRIEVAAVASSSSEVVTTSHITESLLNTGSGCCINGEQYRARIRAVKDNTNLGAWSSWEYFVFYGTGSHHGHPCPLHRHARIGLRL